MSKVLIPLIDPMLINHKFYLRYQMSNGSTQSTCYWSGIYPELNIKGLQVCAKLADILLCYDTCIITIDDYICLINILGLDVVNSLVHEGAIEIYNNKSIKASIANMKENQPLIINFTFEDKFDPELKIKEYLRTYNTTFCPSSLNVIQSTIESSKQINIEKAWINTLNKEIANDLNNHNIINNLGLINGGLILDRDHDYNQFLYNRVAYLNLFLALGDTLSIKNILLPEEIQKLLDVKIGAYIESNNNNHFNLYSSITQFEDMVNVPDILISGIIDFYDIIRIRNNKMSMEFRNWIDNSENSKAPIEYYNAAILEDKKNKFNYTLATLKFAIPTALGIVPNNSYTLAASAIIGSSLFLKDIFKNKFRPNIYINDYLKKEIGIKMNESMFRSENIYYIKKYGKICSNDPCPCCSGKKYKKCHGLYN